MNGRCTLGSALLFAATLATGDCTGPGRRLSHASRAPSPTHPTRRKATVDTLQLKDGDLIFHRSASSQSEAIRIATHSQFNHVGIIFQHKGQFMVFEAVQPVKITPLHKFIARGNNHFTIKRLRDYDTVMTAAVIAKMKDIGYSYLGKDYDLLFRWSDERIYCSELVWKLYKQGAGIEVGKLQTAGELKLDHPVVQKLIRARYGRQAAVPLSEPIVSPQAIFESERLVQVAAQ